MGHRGGFNFGAAPDSLTAPAVPPPPVDPSGFRGYCYMFGSSDPGSRSTMAADPAKARQVLQALYALLPVSATTDNPRIPSGYTYMLQFIAHDLVDTTVPFWAAAEAGVPSRNMRSETLVLDTLYGGGPTVCPIAYESAGKMVDYRTQLRLGQIGDATAFPAATGACPMRDIARLKVDKAPPPSNFEDASQVFVADVRNDDNTLLSQIVVLFSILHNAIADKLAPLGPQASFAHANTAMLLMYYAIIRRDVLKLLLDSRVYDILNARVAASPDWLWKGGSIPLEFSHGAFRVGHAMVRPFYQFNTINNFAVTNVLGGPVLGDPVRDPLPSSWIVEWSRFFDMGIKPNYSLKLAIHQELPLDFVGLFTPIAVNSPEHLTMRDWLSAANARMPRLDAILTVLKQRYPTVSFLEASGIAAWIEGLLGSSQASDATKAIVKENLPLLTADLPLPLYTLLESQLDPAIDGMHMGPFGSVVVGETIFRSLVQQEEKLAQLVPAAQKALGADWQKVQAVGSMPDLIRLAEDWGKLSSCSQIPFIAP